MAKNTKPTATELFQSFLDAIDSMEDKDSSLYEKYYLMKAATKAMENRMEHANGIIISEMERLKVDNQVFDYGTFTLVPRKVWSYSTEVAALEGKVKFQKKQEELLGTAKYELKNSLRFD